MKKKFEKGKKYTQESNYMKVSSKIFFAITMKKPFKIEKIFEETLLKTLRNNSKDFENFWKRRWIVNACSSQLTNKWSNLHSKLKKFGDKVKVSSKMFLLKPWKKVWKPKKYT